MAPGRRSKNNPISKIIILAIFIILAGCLLVFVHYLTTPIVSQSAKERLNDTLHELLDAHSFESVDEYNDEITLGSAKVNVAAVYRASDQNGDVVGYCVQVRPIGYNDEIDMMVAINKAGAVGDVEILSIAETPGTGMKVQLNKDFRQSIIGKAETIKAVKSIPYAAREVQVIAGATVSSVAYINGVNAAMEVVQVLEQEV